MVSANCPTTARLLVLGDKQVGKSAAIVRYTTGRYIQEYGRATGRWLYKHRLGPAAGRRAQSVELLEQKDLKILDSSNLFASDSAPASAAGQSLASRVAMDQQQASELHEKQALMSKLHWANAYVVIYAVNEMSSFNKAIKYLNLIANNINNNNINNNNSSQASLRCASSTSSASSASSASSGSPASAATSTCDHHQLDHLQLIQLTSSADQAACHSNTREQLDPALLAAQTAATCAPSSQRRPILLLANKRDLERHGRQVSSNDGRLLAMRHQSMFAEVSIAETHKLIDLHLATLIDHIDASSLHVDHHHHHHQQQPIQAEINLWKPSIEMALVQTNVNATAPIWASLIKSKSIATSPAPINRANIVKSCAVGGQVAQSAQVGLAKGAKTAQSLTRQSNPAGAPANQNTNHKYETLKSSFKRASMAIVSSKALAMGHSSKPPEPPRQLQSITSPSDHDSILGELSNLGPCETIGENQAVTSSGHLSWFKSHLARNSKQPEAANNKTSSVCSLEGVKPAGSQLSLATAESERSGSRRLLFRYRSRRKTVAFNPCGRPADTGSVKSLEASGELSGPERGKTATKSILNRDQTRQHETRNSTGGAGAGPCYNSARCSSNRSSSSLSTTATEASYPSGSLARRDSPSEPSRRTDSSRPQRRSSSSRASTPDASYEDSGDELTDHPRAGLKSSSLSSASSSSAAPPKEPVKRRHQLVKSVQSTLSNMAMSSRSSNVAGGATKRSFCNSLFKHQPTIEPSKRVDDAPPPALVAKAEHIRTRPTMVGYCK